LKSSISRRGFFPKGEIESKLLKKPAPLHLPNTLFVGKVFHHLQQVDSTNLYAAELLSSGKPPEGTVVSASYQTAGRGQFGRSWQSEAGKNVCMSVIFYPAFLNPAGAFLLNQAIALAVCHTIAAFAKQLPMRIKWPNVIYLGHRKVAGILIQNAIGGQSLRHSICGIGINVNQVVFPAELPNPISLSQVEQRELELAEVIRQLCKHLESRYLCLKQGEFEAVRDDYQAALYCLGEEAQFTKTGSDGRGFLGRIAGVDNAGRLEVETSQGTVVIHSGAYSYQI
jgi:BirA family biotin operon repressor/biotin-[acetyl-CoA-carboxylase] ligase